MEYDLYIFDLDDTLVMTEYYHYLSWMYTLKKLLTNEFFIDYDTYISKFHVLSETGIKDYLIELGIFNSQFASEMKNAYFIDGIKTNKFNTKLNDGCYQFINRILQNKQKFVIVSNSPKDIVETLITKHIVLQSAYKVYYKEMFTNKKPNPECYLKVKLDFPDHKMIGFEDSITGITALMQVPTITPVFINNSNYYHFDYIRKTYSGLKWIKSFTDIIW
jgi:beta-phosphoglucomutase